MSDLNHLLGKPSDISSLESNLMKTKTTTLIKTLAIASVVSGALSCWSASAATAQENWDHNCAACHGKDGKGQTMMGRKFGLKDYTDPKVQSSFTDEEATKAIKEGVKKDGKQEMKAFGDKFSDDDIKALVKYVRDFKGK